MYNFYQCYFEPVLSLFSVVSIFAEMIFKLFCSFPATFINVILHFEPIPSLFSVISVVSAYAELISKLVLSLPTTFINVILHFGRALSLFSVVSVFVDMKFKLVFSFPATYINTALQSERKWKKLRKCWAEINKAFNMSQLWLKNFTCKLKR